MFVIKLVSASDFRSSFRSICCSLDYKTLGMIEVGFNA